MPNDLNISAPPDATDVLDWSQFGQELLKRPFVDFPRCGGLTDSGRGNPARERVVLPSDRYRDAVV